MSGNPVVAGKIRTSTRALAKSLRVTAIPLRALHIPAIVVIERSARRLAPRTRPPVPPGPIDGLSKHALTRYINTLADAIIEEGSARVSVSVLKHLVQVYRLAGSIKVTGSDESEALTKIRIQRSKALRRSRTGELNDVTLFIILNRMAATRSYHDFGPAKEFFEALLTNVEMNIQISPWPAAFKETP